MKTVIQIPHGCTFHNIEDAYPNRVKQYWLDGDRLTVISTNVSDVNPELFYLKVKGEVEMVSYGISTKYDHRDFKGKPRLDVVKY